MNTLRVKIPPALDHALTDASARAQLSKSELVRRAVAAYLGQCGKGPKSPSAIAMAGDLVGCFEGGPRDLSSNPRHLDGFLLARGGHDPAKALAPLARGVVQIGMSLAEALAAVQALFERYDKVPASLADACLVRMSELYPKCRVLTLDADFTIYRRHGRKVIPLLRP